MNNYFHFYIFQTWVALEVQSRLSPSDSRKICPSQWQKERRRYSRRSLLNAQLLGGLTKLADLKKSTLNQLSRRVTLGQILTSLLAQSLCSSTGRSMLSHQLSAKRRSGRHTFGKD
jgi:hypothetical protein